MELKDFIKQAITDISDAINEVNEESNNSNLIINPRSVSLSTPESGLYGYVSGDTSTNEDPDHLRPIHSISFDIAVTSTTKEDGKEGIGVSFSGIKLDKGKNQVTSDNVNSKLSFTLPVALPTGRGSKTKKYVGC